MFLFYITHPCFLLEGLVLQSQFKKQVKVETFVSPSKRSIESLILPMQKSMNFSQTPIKKPKGRKLSFKNLGLEEKVPDKKEPENLVLSKDGLESDNNLELLNKSRQETIDSCLFATPPLEIYSEIYLRNGKVVLYHAPRNITFL